MSRKSVNSESDGSLVYPIRTVSTITGVSPLRLRAWERRYRLVEPRRTAGGHRLYTQQDVNRILQVVALLESGMAIGQVSQVLDTRASDFPAAAEDSLWTGWRNKVAMAVARFDEAALEAVYDEMVAVHPVDRVTHAVLLPLLEQLGRRWRATDGGIAQEHFLAVYLRNKLGARFHHRHHAGSGPKMVVACLPEEQHDAGALLFSLAAHEQGYRLVMLGANMPVGELAHVVQASQADAVVLSGSNDLPAGWFEEHLADFVRATPQPVFVGGSTSLTSHHEIVGVGAVPLGCDIESGIGRITQCVEQSRIVVRSPREA